MSIIYDHNLGNVWAKESGRFNGMLRREYLAWLTPSQRCRAERLRQAKMLFEGDHREYFVCEGRSQINYKPRRENEPPYFDPDNLLTLVAQKMADLLFGEACRITVNDKSLQAVIDAIVDRSWLPARLNGIAAECCWAGETLFEVTRVSGEAVIGHIPVDEIFPIGVAGPDYQYPSYVRYATQFIPGDRAKGVADRQLLLETTYTAGHITRALYELAQVGGSVSRKQQKLSMDQWPFRLADGSQLPDDEVTGLSTTTIIRVPNGHNARSDFEGLLEAQDSCHQKNTQISRVIADVVDPKLAAPEAAADEHGNLPTGQVFFYKNKDEVPSYIELNPELAAAMEDRSFARSKFATAAEMPLSLLGVKDDSAVESATKMRLNASSAIAKASRKAAYWQAAIRMVIALAIEVETGSRPSLPIAVEMRDGLPVDEVERATMIATLRTAGVLSVHRALILQWMDPAAAEEEEARIQHENSQSMPSTLLGEPNGAGLNAPNPVAATSGQGVSNA